MASLLIDFKNMNSKSLVECASILNTGEFKKTLIDNYRKIEISSPFYTIREYGENKGQKNIFHANGAQQSGYGIKFSNFLDQIQNTNIFIAFYLFLDFLEKEHDFGTNAYNLFEGDQVINNFSSVINNNKQDLYKYYNILIQKLNALFIYNFEGKNLADILPQKFEGIKTIIEIIKIFFKNLDIDSAIELYNYIENDNVREIEGINNFVTTKTLTPNRIEYLNDIRLGQLIQYKLDTLDTLGKDKFKAVEKNGIIIIKII